MLTRFARHSSRSPLGRRAVTRRPGQQADRAVDSTQGAGDSTARAAQAAVSAARVERRDRLPVVFYGVLGAAAVTAADPARRSGSGGYHDGWTTATDFPDKAVHALAAWAITSVGVDLGARPRYAALAVCAAGTAFEFAQGYVSVYDIARGLRGAAGAAAWQSWRATPRARDRRASAGADGQQRVSAAPTLPAQSTAYSFRSVHRASIARRARAAMRTRRSSAHHRPTREQWRTRSTTAHRR